MDRALDWLLLATLAAFGAVAALRSAAQYARGVPVIVIDRERSPLQILRDLAVVACLVLWIQQALAFAWPLPGGQLPPPLSARLPDALPLQLLGLAFLWLGLACYALALRDFGDSWRLGIDRARPGGLVTSGIFARSRNPIYLAFLLMLLGTFLLLGPLVFLAIGVGMAAGLHATIRQEEGFLEERFGDAYRSYRLRVGRWWTWRQPAG